MTPDGTCVTALDPVKMTKWNGAKSKHPLWKDLKLRRKVIWDKLKVTFFQKKKKLTYPEFSFLFFLRLYLDITKKSIPSLPRGLSYLVLTWAR